MSRLSVSRWLIAALMLTGLSACAAPAPLAQPTAPVDAQATRHVLAVETFLADIAQNVAGDRATIEPLIPIGVDPHSFEPTPADARKVADSTLLIANGAGFESFLENLLENAGGQRQVVEAVAGLTSRTAREGEEAVMTEEEKAEALCAGLPKMAAEEVTAGVDAVSAAELHTHAHETATEHQHEHEPAAGHVHEASLVMAKLAPAADGGFGGFVRLDAAEAGDYQLATAAGQVVVSDAQGQEIEIEESYPLNCGGLAQAHMLELAPGEYTVALAGFAAETTPLLAGMAGGHHHDAGDPHFWLDPINVIKYTENIRDGLSQADPGGAATYARNAEAYIAELRELDAWIREQVEQIPEARRLLVTNHESFGYFADRYGFKIIGTVIPSVSSGASPSAEQFARLTDRINATGAQAIFLETGADPQLAQQLAQEVGVKAVTELFTHSITDPNGPAPTYIEMMKYNVRAIVDALK
jgi:ABC-type Zn uptake system ZnuABC Zn-binding protein ZnuA